MANAKHPLNSNAIVIDEDTTAGAYRIRNFASPTVTGTVTGTMTFATKAALYNYLNSLFRFVED